MLSVNVWIARSLEQSFRAKRQRVPDPIPCRALIDTGSEQTFFRQAFAADLALEPVGMVSTLGAHTASEKCPVYPIRLLLPSNETLVDMTLAVGVPLPDKRIDVLIGRDILKSAAFKYIGPRNIFTLAL